MRIATAKQTYQADEALFDTRVQRLWLLFLAAALALFPSLPTPTGCTWPVWWPSTWPAPPG